MELAGKDSHAERRCASRAGLDRIRALPLGGALERDAQRFRARAARRFGELLGPPYVSSSSSAIARAISAAAGAALHRRADHRAIVEQHQLAPEHRPDR